MEVDCATSTKLAPGWGSLVTKNLPVQPIFTRGKGVTSRFSCRLLIHKQLTFLAFPFSSSYTHLYQTKFPLHFSHFSSTSTTTFASNLFHDQYTRFKQILTIPTLLQPPNLNNTIITQNAFHSKDCRRSGLCCLCFRRSDL